MKAQGISQTSYNTIKHQAAVGCPQKKTKKNVFFLDKSKILQGQGRQTQIVDKVSSTSSTEPVLPALAL